MPRNDDVNSALRVLISSQEQTHSCVKELSKDVKRNTALVVANGVRLDTVIKETRENDDRLTDVELWRATHSGVKIGKEERRSIFSSKTTLICTVVGTLLALLGMWFTLVQPALSMNAEVLSEFKALNGQLSELEMPFLKK